jgi:hypothetical protein
MLPGNEALRSEGIPLNVAIEFNRVLLEPFKELPGADLN